MSEEELAKRVGSVEAQIRGVDNRLSNVETSLTSIGATIITTLTALDVKVDGIKDKQSEVDGYTRGAKEAFGSLRVWIGMAVLVSPFLIWVGVHFIDTLIPPRDISVDVDAEIVP